MLSFSLCAPIYAAPNDVELVITPTYAAPTYAELFIVCPYLCRPYLRWAIYCVPLFTLQVRGPVVLGMAASGGGGGGRGGVTWGYVEWASDMAKQVISNW